MESRYNKFDWPIIIIYSIIFLIIIGTSVVICICFCDKTDELEGDIEDKNLD